MSGNEMVVAIVFIATVGGMYKMRYGNGNGGVNVSALTEEVNRLRNEVAQLRQQRSSGSVSREDGSRVAALEKEVAELRDTTTKFDMAFDAALDRVESRVDSMERVQANQVYGNSDRTAEPVVAGRR